MFFGFLASKLRMELKELKHAHTLEIKEKDAEFQRGKSQWDEDKARLIKELESNHALKLKEVVTLTKLDSEQKVKQLELDSQRKIDALKNENIKEISLLKENLLTDHYNKLSVAMGKLHEEGNHTTRFTQELALKMFESAPKHTVRTEQITGSIDVGIDKNEK